MTLAVAVVSALTGQVAQLDVAMTGELTLAATIEPVGGIPAKVLGRAGHR